MKRDMGGAAAIFGAFKTYCELKNQTTSVYAILCLAENSVGPLATRPDDIHVSYSGKSIEINNTDAEGRLALADGVAYASKHIKPAILLDMATLTGAQGIVSGPKFCSIMTDSETLEKLTVRKGLQCGEMCAPIIYCPEFLQNEFSSSVADMKNSVKNRANAQCSCAGN